MTRLFCALLILQCLTSVFCISAEHKNAILKAHNDYRRQVAKGKTPSQPAAADMLEMVWDDSLAKKAEEWAGNCQTDHDSYDDRKNPNYQFVGQNLYAGPDVTEAVQNWFDEYKEFDFGNNDCSGVCGHYTQVAWAKSYAVGCGAVNCQQKTGSFPYGWLVICNYGPAGNFNNEPPYVAGPACSKCPNKGACKDGLCAAPAGKSRPRRFTEEKVDVPQL